MRVKRISRQAHPELKDSNATRPCSAPSPSLAATSEAVWSRWSWRRHPAGMTNRRFSATRQLLFKTAQHPPAAPSPAILLSWTAMRNLLVLSCAAMAQTFASSFPAYSSTALRPRKISGIPPEQVVGSSSVTTFAVGNSDGKPFLMKPAKGRNSSTTVPASRSASTATSAAARSWPSATWSRRRSRDHCNGPRAPAPLRASLSWRITRDAQREYRL